MTLSRFLSAGPRVTRLRWIMRIGATVTALLVVALGIAWFLAERALATETQNLKKVESEIATAQETVRRAGNVVSSARDAGTDAVAAYSQALDDAALEQECTVVEFVASSEPQPFLSRFTDDASDMGCHQIEARFSLRGSLFGIVRTLQQVAAEGVPFEFDSAEFVVDVAGADTSPVVLANIKVRVMFRAQGAA